VLILMPTLGRTDEPIGQDLENAAKAARPGLTGTPARAEQAVTERGVIVRLLKGRLEMPTSVAAGEVTFAITNAGTRARGFKIAGPGLRRELNALLLPGQTKTMAVNLRPGVYRVEAPVQGEAAERLSTELIVRGK
jgi:hypothetical protein